VYKECSTYVLHVQDLQHRLGTRLVVSSVGSVPSFNLRIYLKGDPLPAWLLTARKGVAVTCSAISPAQAHQHGAHFNTANIPWCTCAGYGIRTRLLFYSYDFRHPVYAILTRGADTLCEEMPGTGAYRVQFHAVPYVVLDPLRQVCKEDPN
jgi:hypothetical protein